MQRSNVVRRTAGVVFMSVVVACGEPPESVTGSAARIRPADPAAPAAVLDISSGAGVLFLDPNTMILSDAEGRQVQLEGETQTVVLNTVDLMAVTDVNLQTFASEPLPQGGGECSPFRGDCPQDRLAPAPNQSRQRPRIDDAFQGRLKLKIDRTRRHRARGPAPRVGSAPAADAPEAGLFQLASWSAQTPCFDIAVAIYGITQHYNALKTAWAFDVRARINGVATGTVQSGAAPTLSSFLSGLPVAMAVWYQDFMTTRTTLDQLAYRYSESACWTRSWADQSAVVRDGFSPTGSGRVGFYMKTCNPVYIEIEIDGQLFYAGWGEECDYRFFPYQEDRADPVVGRQGSDRGDRSPPNGLQRTHFTV